MYAAIMGAQDLNVNIVLSLWKTKILIPIVGPSRPTGKSIHPSTLLLNYWWVRKKIKCVGQRHMKNNGTRRRGARQTAGRGGITAVWFTYARGSPGGDAHKT